MEDRFQFWARLAGYPLWLACRFRYGRELFRGYEINPDPADRAGFRRLCREAGRPETPLAAGAESHPGEEGYPPEYRESLGLYRQICDLLLRQDVLLFHSSAVEREGRAYLFAAPSGTGKSTHARLWRQRFGEAVTVLNDDKPLLRFEPSGQVLACGTPYAGKEDLHTNRMAPVAGILVLYQNPENIIRPMTAREALPVFYRQSFRSLSDPVLIGRSLELVARLTRLPVYRMGCTVSEEAAELAWRTLRGEDRK